MTAMICLTPDSFAKIRASAHKCGSAQNDVPEDEEITEYLVVGVLQ